MEIFLSRVFNSIVAIRLKTNVNSIQPIATYQEKKLDINTLNDAVIVHSQYSKP